MAEDQEPDQMFADLFAALQQWTAGDRASRDRAIRTDARWARQVAVEEMDLGDVLSSACEAAVVLQLTMSDNRAHRATVTAIGCDFVGTVTENGAMTLVRLDAITSVTITEKIRPPSNRTLESPRPCLEDALALMVADRPILAWTVVGSDVMRSGELSAVGNGIAIFIISSPKEHVVVPIDRFVEVTLVQTTLR